VVGTSLFFFRLSNKLDQLEKKSQKEKPNREGAFVRWGTSSEEKKAMWKLKA